MNKYINCPFSAAEIEIVNTVYDIITASPDPFPGEDDEFDILYWNS